ncbi:unnamed protein product [Choristocarpus tenellus]
MLKAGGLKGTMQQCLQELRDTDLPADFKLKQTRSLLRYLREVSGLVEHIKSESGWECDTTSYLEILSAKEDSNLLRRISDTRILKQDFDDKRREWRKQKKNMINAISEMKARALKFECTERRTIALYAIQYYKNLMTASDGAIPGESESTDGLVEQYRRHRDEISKIPMYTDSIVKMLKDIRRTVRASAKIQPGTNAFTQFLDEWWASVVSFLQHSSIVNAERNAREVMQTLKRLKGKQEENKKREMTRLLSKLDAHGDLPLLPLPTAKEEEPELCQETLSNPEETVRSSERRENSCIIPQESQDQTMWEENIRSESDGDGDDEGVTVFQLAGKAGKDSDALDLPDSISLTSSEDLGDIDGRASFGNLSCIGVKNLMLDIGNTSSTSWDGASEMTAGTDTGTDRDINTISGSGLPREDDSDDEEDDDLFEAADSMDLGAVALCAAPNGGATYQDVTQTPSALRYLTDKLGVEQQRYSAALDYFRQEQELFRGKAAALPPPPSPSRARLKSGARISENKLGGTEQGHEEGAGRRGSILPSRRNVMWKSSTILESPRPQSLYLPRSASQRGIMGRQSKGALASPRVPTPRCKTSMTPLAEK